MRLFVTATILLSTDNDQLKKKLSETVYLDDTSTKVEKFQQGDIQLDPSDSVALDFGSVDEGNALIIICADEVNVSINGAAAPFSLLPEFAEDVANPISTYQQEDQPGLLILKGVFTSVTVSNPSADLPASFYYAIIGKLPVG